MTSGLFREGDDAGNWWKIPSSVDHNPSWVATAARGYTFEDCKAEDPPLPVEDANRIALRQRPWDVAADGADPFHEPNPFQA